MKCSACGEITTNLWSYGGANICSYCYDRYNPTVKTVHKLSNRELMTLERQKLELEIKLSQIKKEIEEQKYLDAHGLNSMEIKLIKC